MGGLFELDDLGAHALKGFAEPLAAGGSRARAGPRAASRRASARASRRWSAASEELALLLAAGGRPRTAKARSCCSRASRASASRASCASCASGSPASRTSALSYHCSPHHTNSALYPVIEQLERAAGFERDDPPEAKLDKLEALLARGTDRLRRGGAADRGAARHPDGGALSAARPDPAAAEAADARGAGWISSTASRRKQPVLLIYEDVHWIDPTSLELLGLTVERIQRLPVLLIITFRPEFTPPWSGQPHVTALALTRLGRRDGAAMVEQVAGGKALPAEIRAQIVAKTDGVPLFVEELTKTVLESGLLEDAGDRYELTGPLPPLAIPATLHDSLMARLDRLAPVKEVAQIGAVIGREFGHELLAAVADLPEASCRPPSTSSSPPSSSSAAARRPRRPTASSTRWSRTPPTRACSRAAASSSTRGSRRCWRSSFPEQAEPSQSCSPSTAPRRD